MSTYQAIVHWQRHDQDFLGQKYSREHIWQFGSNTMIAASASPHIVPAPWSDGEKVDPEEAFVASLSSCHMLFFLALAAKEGIEVNSYRDAATGLLADRGDGKLAMTEVTLNPIIDFGEDSKPDREQINALHHSAHEKCFIANSVTTRVVINVQQDQA